MATLEKEQEESFYCSKRGSVVIMLGVVCAVGYLDRSVGGLLILPMGEELQWSMEERGRVLAAFFTGYIFTQIPGGILAQRLGARRVLGTALGVWSTAVVMAPWAAAISPNALCALLMVVGLSQVHEQPHA